MPEEKVARELIHLIYECAVDARLWSHFLAKYAKAIEAHAAGLIVQDLKNQQGNVSESVGFDPFWERLYAERYAGLNVWLLRSGGQLQAGSVLVGEQFVRDQELEKTEFYNDFLRPQQHFHTCGGTITRERSVLSALTAVRSKRVGMFEDPETGLLRELLPHLQSAVGIHHRIAGLETRLDAAGSALNHVSQGVLIADASGHVLFMNHRAEAILRGNWGLSLGTDGLRAGSARETARLRELIFRAAATIDGNGRHPGGGLSIARPGRHEVLKVQVAPLASSSSDAKRRPAAIVFMTEPEEKAYPDAALLGELLDLTPAEAHLTAALVAGKTVKEFAEETGVSLNTARTHLKRVFSKTRVSRQADLIRLVLS